MKAFRTTVNFSTGKRADGSLDPKGKDHVCNASWQDNENGFEYRIFKPGADTTAYAGIDGLVGFDTFEEAEQAMTDDGLKVSEFVYKNTNPQLTQANIAATFDAADYDGMLNSFTDQEELKYLFDRNISGIVKIEKKRAKMEEIFAGL